MNKKLLLAVGALSMLSVNVFAIKAPDGRFIDETAYVYSIDKNITVTQPNIVYDNIMPPRDITDNVSMVKTYDVNLNKDLVDMSSATFETFLDEDQPDFDTNPDADDVFRRTVINGNGITITKEKYLDPNDNPPHNDSEREIYKTVSLTNNGLDNGGNRIINVKNGENSTDAVNVSQLKAVENKINNINNIAMDGVNRYTDQQINKGVAKASALAGLKYLDYNPKDKWSFAASVGHYRNANAVAVGAAYQPNENTMIHGGITLDGKTAYNLGVSFKTGGQKYINKYELAEQVKQLQSDNAELRQELNELRSMIEKNK